MHEEYPLMVVFLEGLAKGIVANAKAFAAEVALISVHRAVAVDH